MKVTRNSVFETNSSSVHTFTIGEGHGYKPDPELAKKINRFYLRFDWYEWGPDTVDTPERKVSYLISAIWCTDGYNSIPDEIWSNDTKRISWAMDFVNKSDGLKLIKKAIDDYYGKDVELVWDVSDDAGHIDHQSIEDYKSFSDFLEGKGIETVDKLRDFIFGDDSWIIIGNDNDAEYY